MAKQTIKFDTHIFFRHFVPSSLMDEYEQKCNEISKKYAGQPTDVALPKMVKEMNKALTDMSKQMVAMLKESEPIEMGTTDTEDSV